MKRLYYFGADCPELRDWIVGLRTPATAELCFDLLAEAQMHQEVASEYLWAVNEVLHMEQHRLLMDNAPRLSLWDIQEWFTICFNTARLMRNWAIENAISEGMGRAEAERLQVIQEEAHAKILAYVKEKKDE